MLIKTFFLFSSTDYLCSPEDNLYNIDFTRFKIRDMETATILFEITKPPATGECDHSHVISCIEKR